MDCYLRFIVDTRDYIYVIDEIHQYQSSSICLYGIAYNLTLSKKLVRPYKAINRLMQLYAITSTKTDTRLDEPRD